MKKMKTQKNNKTPNNEVANKNKLIIGKNLKILMGLKNIEYKK